MLLAAKTYISKMNQKSQLKIHPKMINGLQGMIPGGVSVEDFSAVTKMTLTDSKIILDELIKNEIGTKEDTSYYFEDGDKLKTAVSLLEKGFPIDEISIALDWRDFEGLTAEILTEKNFAVMKNMMLQNLEWKLMLLVLDLALLF